MKNKIKYVKSNFLKDCKNLNRDKIVKSPRVWTKNKKVFRKFWKNRIMNEKIKYLPRKDLNQIIMLLDTKGRGKERGKEAVANTGIRMGVWHKAFKNIKKNKKLRNA